MIVILESSYEKALDRWSAEMPDSASFPISAIGVACSNNLYKTEKVMYVNVSWKIQQEQS
jgi:hypothetical protein